MMRNVKRRLFRHGMLLFLIGLLTGLVEEKFSNPRMGLSAHLEGILNGILLLALGALWPELRLSPRTMTVAYWSTLCGTYGNWGVTTLAAIFATGAMTPIAAQGLSAQPWQENLITVGFISVGLAILSAAVLLLWGLRAADPERQSG